MLKKKFGFYCKVNEKIPNSEITRFDYFIKTIILELLWIMKTKKP